MPPRPFVPQGLHDRPFAQSEGLSHGLTVHMLNGPTWKRLMPRVWAHRDHQMSDADWIVAAALAMPARAQLSHVSRIQVLGLDVGETKPVHFTVSGDLHLDLEDIFLHRTEVLPPLDAVGVTPAAAFVQFCAEATMLEAIVAGDWLLHHRHMTAREVGELSLRDRWRPGSRQVRRVLGHLDPASRSPKESETRALIVFSGLPAPEVNVEVVVEGEVIGIVDLLIRCVMLALEYEGRQHAESTAQFNRDVHRYAAFRRHAVEYLQVTQEMLVKPKVAVTRIHHRMIELGYEGPAPLFGDRWDALFATIPSGAGVARPARERRPAHRPRQGRAIKSPPAPGTGD